MKKIYITSFAMLMTVATFAQTSQSPGKKIKGDFPKKKIQKTENNRAASYSFYTDYEAADRSMQNTAYGYENYFRFITDANTAYGSTVNSALYPVVAFYDFNDSYGVVSGTGTPETMMLASGAAVTIDSVYAVIGHYNTTAGSCTLRVKVLSLDAANRPTTTVLFTKDVVATELNPGAAAWNYTTVWGTDLNFTLPVGVTKYGIQLDYIGAIADTFGIIYGAVADYNTCGSTGLEAYDPAGNLIPGTPVVSSFDNNSLVANAMYYSTYPLLPSSGGADFYIDCDASGGVTTGDGVSLYQNWSIWTKVTADLTFASIDENSAISSLEQNMPNPFNENTTINYSLASASQVRLVVTDLSGKVVMTESYGNVNSGRHSININAKTLESGVYYYTLVAGNAKQTRKMVITK